uniref:Uncharacterized protein n=1 Tax=Arundo donax TaxID=35708 RepID=A0A0A9CQI4_ARUDO
MPVLLVRREGPAPGRIGGRHMLVLVRMLVLPGVVIGHRAVVDRATRVIRRCAGGALRRRAGGHRGWHEGGHLWRSRHWFNLPRLRSL